MIHKEHGLIISIDVQPSEQLNYNDEITACFCGVMCHPDGIKGLLQYKDTPASERPTIAIDLAKKLVEKNIVRAVGFIARYKSIEKYGRQFLSDLPNKVARKQGKRYNIMGKKLNENVAILLPWYSVALCMTGLRAAIWANKLKVKKVTLVTDKLPGSPKIAMEFVRRISHHPDIFPLWKKTEEEFGVQFHITNMESFLDKDKNERSPDDNPTMIMADWIAHSLFAATNKSGDLDGDADRNEDYRRDLTEPWFKLYENEMMNLVPLDRLVINSK